MQATRALHRQPFANALYAVRGAHYTSWPRSWVTRKNEMSSVLRYNLLAFTNPSSDSTVAAEANMSDYEMLQTKFVIPNAESTIHVRGIAAVFFARFYTMHEILSRTDSAASEELKALLQKKQPLAEAKRCIAEEVKKTLDSQQGLRERNSFKEVVAAHFGNDKLTEEFIACDRAILAKVRDRDAHMTVLFNLGNSRTLLWSKAQIEPDLKKLTKPGTRFRSYVQDSQPIVQVAGVLATFEIYKNLSHYWWP